MLNINDTDQHVSSVSQLLGVRLNNVQYLESRLFLGQVLASALIFSTMIILCLATSQECRRSIAIGSSYFPVSQDNIFYFIQTLIALPEGRGYVHVHNEDEFDIIHPPFTMDDALVAGDHYEGYILSVFHQLHCLVGYLSLHVEIAFNHIYSLLTKS